MKAATSMEESHDTKSCSYRIKSEEKEKRLGTCTASATSGGNRVDDGSNSNEANCTTTPREISTGETLFEKHKRLSKNAALEKKRMKAKADAKRYELKRDYIREKSREYYRKKKIKLSEAAALESKKKKAAYDSKRYKCKKDEISSKAVKKKNQKKCITKKLWPLMV